MVYFGNPSKIGFVFFRIDYILKNLTLKIFNFDFDFMDTHYIFLEKITKMGVHYTYYLSGGPKLIS